MQPLNFFPKGFQRPQGLKPDSSRKEIKKALLQNPEKLAEYILAASKDETWRKEKTNQEFLSKLTSKITQVQLPHSLALQILKVAKEVLDLPPNHPLFTTATMHCAGGEEIEENKFALKAFSPVFQSMFERGLSETLSGEVTYADLSKEAASLFKKVVEGETLDFSSVSGETLFELLSFLHRHDPQEKILPKIYKQLESEGQISENNILGLLHYSQTFHLKDVAHSCIKFLNQVFPEIELFFLNGQETFYYGIDIQSNIPEEKLEEVASLLQNLDEKLFHICVSQGKKEEVPYSLRDAMNRGKVFQYLCNSPDVKKWDLKFTQRFIQKSLLLKNPLTQESVKQLLQLKTEIFGILEREVLPISDVEALRELLSFNGELRFSFHEIPELIFNRTASHKIHIEIRGLTDEECLKLSQVMNSLKAFSRENKIEIDWGLEAVFSFYQTEEWDPLRERKKKVSCEKKVFPPLGPIFRAICDSREISPWSLTRKLEALDELIQTVSQFKQLTLEKLFEWENSWEADVVRNCRHKLEDPKTLVELLTAPAECKLAMGLRVLYQGVAFERIGPDLISIDPTSLNDQKSFQLISSLDLLQEVCKSKNIQIQVLKYVPNKSEEDPSVIKEFLMRRGASLELFLSFLKEDLPLLLQPVTLESAASLLTSLSQKGIELRGVKKMCRDILEKTLLQTCLHRDRGTRLEVLSFFDEEELALLKAFPPLLRDIYTIDCSDVIAISLKPELLIELAAMCPNVTRIDLKYCKKFKGKHVTALKAVCPKLQEVKMSLQEVLGITTSPISPKAMKTLQRLGCQVTVCKDNRSAKEKQKSKAEEEEMKKSVKEIRSENKKR